ncbi:heavy metal sensor histidine kinase [Rhodoferax sp.]|uniref:heavy metal sensor histidine kinase n=1 Tax=Rhodoferax sp. TaxID=50421 RepID=UPI0026232F1A|nr:heavy metal sensor histidine kinase [Rhodoferax sp.]MDD2924931.1 heavy metal sensor histidine kinase [Rhodoferax sp.]
MRRLSQMSLTRRLTLMFVTAATAVLLLLGWVVASSVEQHFEDLDMEVLSGKMELIRQGLQTVTSPEGLIPFTHQLARSLVGHHGLEVMVLDADRSVIFATTHAGFSPELVVTHATRVPPHPALWTLEGQTYRGIAAQMPLATPDAAGHPMQVFVAAATDIGHHQAYMRSFLRTLWLFVAVAALLTGALGWAVVRRGLAPLHAMREQAQVVTAQQLNHRLPVQHMPAELAELAQSLNDMLARLALAFARLSDFSSDIAHELRTPVSNLMTQTQVALSRTRSATEYRSVLESNAEEFDRMARMISDMLLLAKADHGLVLLQRETLQLAQEVRAVFDYFEMLAEEKKLSLQWSGEATLMADRLMLRRALGNLLSNAVRHATPATEVRVTLSQTAQEVVIAVQNTGDTIPPEALARVFDRFFRVDPARQRNSEGTGLGLAITRSIINAHGGTISASSMDKLTTLTIRLPR